MKTRFISLALVLLPGLIAYLVISRAPVRVHLATLLAWVPSLILLLAVTWTNRLRRVQKIFLIGLLMPMAGGLIAYFTATVVTKVDFNARLWLANTALFLITIIIVAVLTHLCERILLWIVRPKK